MRFNRINSGRSIPTTNYDTDSRVVTYHGFNRINSGRSIPTISVALFCLSMFSVFQSYQFRQINPDLGTTYYSFDVLFKFQSYQFRQINPDWRFSTFNQLKKANVSIVSIQADQSRR